MPRSHLGCQPGRSDPDHRFVARRRRLRRRRFAERADARAFAVTESPAAAAPPPAGGTTITITSTGVSPKDIVVARGARVTFVNNDNVGHDMNSDPHPEHTSCTDMNVGNVAPTQNRQTDVLNIARRCGYHDHNQPSNGNLQGTITIQ